MIDQRIPAYSDAELANLHVNALRLSQSGTDAQKAEAERLLPIINAEVEKRRLARLQRMAQARVQRREAANAKKAARAEAPGH